MGLTSMLVSTISWGFGRVSLSGRYRFAERLAAMEGAQSSATRQLARRNLAAAFPIFPDAVLDATVDLNARRMARARVDYLWSLRASKAELVQRVVLSGLEAIPDDRPVVIVGLHQPGMEMAAQRLATEIDGAVIVDRGTDPTMRSVHGAWTRFGDHQLIDASGGVRPAMRAMRAGRHLLVFADEPDQPLRHVRPVRLGNALVRFSALPSLLARACGADLVGMQVRQLPGGSYAVTLRPLLPAARARAQDDCARAMGARLNAELLADPAGYWWSRRALGRVEGRTVARRETGMAATTAA